MQLYSKRCCSLLNYLASVIALVAEKCDYAKPSKCMVELAVRVELEQVQFMDSWGFSFFTADIIASTESILLAPLIGGTQSSSW